MKEFNLTENDINVACNATSIAAEKKITEIYELALECSNKNDPSFAWYTEEEKRLIITKEAFMLGYRQALMDLKTVTTEA